MIGPSILTKRISLFQPLVNLAPFFPRYSRRTRSRFMLNIFLPVNGNNVLCLRCVFGRSLTWLDPCSMRMCLSIAMWKFCRSCWPVLRNSPAGFSMCVRHRKDGPSWQTRLLIPVSRWGTLYCRCIRDLWPLVAGYLTQEDIAWKTKAEEKRILKIGQVSRSSYDKRNGPSLIG